MKQTLTHQRYVKRVQRSTNTISFVSRFLQVNLQSFRMQAFRLSSDLFTKQKVAAVKPVHGSGGDRRVQLFIRISGNSHTKPLQKNMVLTISSGNGTDMTIQHQETGIRAMNMLILLHMTSTAAQSILLKITGSLRLYTMIQLQEAHSGVL